MLEKNIKHKTVKISQRIVFHKYAEVLVQVPIDILDDDIVKWVDDNDEIVFNKLQKVFDKEEFEEGSGYYDYEGFNTEDDIETRYSVLESGYGGHL